MQEAAGLWNCTKFDPDVRCGFWDSPQSWVTNISKISENDFQASSLLGSEWKLSTVDIQALVCKVHKRHRASCLFPGSSQNTCEKPSQLWFTSTRRGRTGQADSLTSHLESTGTPRVPAPAVAEGWVHLRRPSVFFIWWSQVKVSSLVEQRKGVCEFLHHSHDVKEEETGTEDHACACEQGYLCVLHGQAW